MSKKIQELFLFSAAVILFLSAAAELLSVTGPARLLNEQNPFLLLPNRQVLVLSAILELLVSAFLVMGRSHYFKLTVTAWLATNLLAYRLGMQWMGASNVCDYLGGLNNWLLISAKTVNGTLLVILSYLLAGGYVFLVLDCLGARKVPEAGTAAPDIEHSTSKESVKQ